MNLHANETHTQTRGAHAYDTRKHETTIIWIIANEYQLDASIVENKHENKQNTNTNYIAATKTHPHTHTHKNEHMYNTPESPRNQTPILRMLPVISPFSIFRKTNNSKALKHTTVVAGAIHIAWTDEDVSGSVA